MNNVLMQGFIENKEFFINAFVEYDKETQTLTIENSEGKQVALFTVLEKRLNKRKDKDANSQRCMS